MKIRKYRDKWNLVRFSRIAGNQEDEKQSTKFS